MPEKNETSRHNTYINYKQTCQNQLRMKQFHTIICNYPDAKTNFIWQTVIRHTLSLKYVLEEIDKIIDIANKLMKLSNKVKFQPVLYYKLIEIIYVPNNHEIEPWIEQQSQTSTHSLIPTPSCNLAKWCCPKFQPVGFQPVSYY